MLTIVRFERRKEVIKVERKRPGSNAVGQLLIDLLNVRSGRPRGLRLRRFRAKWGLEPDTRLIGEAENFYLSGLGPPVAPVYRRARGAIHQGPEWVPLVENSEQAQMSGGIFLSHATRADVADDYTKYELNRHGILERVLDQKMRIYLAREFSAGADYVARLMEDLQENDRADLRRFPLREEIECKSPWCVILLEALHLIYSDRQIERCQIADVPHETRIACGIERCKAPYFVAPRRGTRGCPIHRGREFRRSERFKRLVRAGHLG